MTPEEKKNPNLLPQNSKVFASLPLHSQGAGFNEPFLLNGKEYKIPYSRHWTTDYEGLKRLEKSKRLIESGTVLRYKLYFNDFSLQQLTTTWSDTSPEFFKDYVVQTSTKVIERCLLMTTDPGDLCLDITCGSGTTAYVAEQWGRRWITCDTSRVAITLAKQRLMTALFDYYELAYPQEGVGSGFRYKTVPHITLKSIANNEPPGQETLYDQPFVDNSRARVTGPFIVEAVPAPMVKPLDVIASETKQSKKKGIASPSARNDQPTQYQVEVLGFDYYNTKTGNIESGGTDKIAMWMLDTDYDGRSLFPRQVFFPMAGEKDGWSRLAKNLKAVIDEELIEAYRGNTSLPFEIGDNRRIAVKIVDDRGIESLKILEVE